MRHIGTVGRPVRLGGAVMMGLVCALLGLHVTTATAQAQPGNQPGNNGVYKWTDEEGGVHYSQTPPSDAEKYNTESLDIQLPPPGTASAMAPTTVDGKLMCGTVSLPMREENTMRYIHNLRMKLFTWEKFAEEMADKRDENSRDRLKQVRCAIAYANKELAGLSAEEEKYLGNYDQAREELASIEEEEKRCDLRAEAEADAPPADECKRALQKRKRELEQIVRRLAPAAKASGKQEAAQ